MTASNPPHILESLFGRFFSLAEKAKERAEKSGRPSTAGQGPKGQEESFEGKLRDIAKHQDLVVAGNLHVLNVTKIKAKVGAKWPRLKSLISMNIEKIIQDHLGPDDVMMMHSELNYIVIFPNDTKAVAERKLKVISRQIIERIFGTEALMRGFALQSTVGEMDATELQGDDGTIKNLMEAISAQAEPQHHSWETIEREKAAAQASLNEDVVLAHVSSLLDKLGRNLHTLYAAQDKEACHTALDGIEQNLEETIDLSDRFLMAHPISEADTSESSENREFLQNVLETTTALSAEVAAVRPHITDAVLGEGRNQNLDLDELGADIMESAIQVDVDPDALPDLTEGRELLSGFGNDCSFHYFPVWDVRLEMVNNYRCSIGVTKNDTVQELRNMMPSQSKDAIFERLDLITLQKSLIDLREVVSSEIRCTFTLTVRFSLLQAPKSRAVIAQLFHPLTAKERHLVVIKIVDVPANTWASNIVDKVAFLKPFCRVVIVELMPRPQGLNELKEAGVFAVGYHMPKLEGKEAHRLQELEWLVTHAEKVGLTSFVSGVDQISVAASAVGTGVRYIDGMAVGLPLDLPWGILPFALESIYTRLLTA